MTNSTEVVQTNYLLNAMIAMPPPEILFHRVCELGPSIDSEAVMEMILLFFYHVLELS